MTTTARTVIHASRREPVPSAHGAVDTGKVLRLARGGTPGMGGADGLDVRADGERRTAARRRQAVSAESRATASTYSASVVYPAPVQVQFGETTGVDKPGRLVRAEPERVHAEPFVVDKTGLSVEEHQERTVENYLTLRAMAPDLPFIPVLQGWMLDDYLHCVDLYALAGVDLTALPLVGIGSVCRRQNTAEVDHIVSTVASLGIALHGFGVKTVGLTAYASQPESADSLAWSYRARNAPALPGCTHKSCANCPRFALRWREKVLRRTGTQRLPFGAAA